MKSLSEMAVQFIKGVGPARKKLFEKLGVATVEVLLFFFSLRDDDRRHLVPIVKTKVGEFQTISGKVLKKSGRRSWYTKKHLLEVEIDDKTGRMTCVWFNQPFLANYFKEDTFVVCHGKVDLYKNRLQMVSPEYEVIDEQDNATSLNRIVPVYPLTRGVTQRYLRKIIAASL